ncbi:uncharacterized protein LOC113295850 [Papaver somniferum]|uniref:uncharacterized protein LOC113295850 n=1 Tax=Papaver somniferum TaxID=3469 RepID=UPI000E6FDD29|nr:uncharacterized protein LOC113295850 [Papaver somniferum]
MMQKMMAGWMVKKLITVKWDAVNTPVDEGGLGLRKLKVMNKSVVLKLLWKIETEDVELTSFMRAKYKNKNGEWSNTYKQSSILPGLEWVIFEFNNGSRWLVVDGKNISVWKDKWIEEYALIERYSEDAYVQQNIDMKVEQLIQDGEWHIPECMNKYFEVTELPAISAG